MKTADEFVRFVEEHHTGKGFNKSWTQKHFEAVANHLDDDEFAHVAFIGLGYATLSLTHSKVTG